MNDDVVLVKKNRVRFGKDGDSLFVMNKAAELWQPKTLAIRSATGLVSSKKRKMGETRG